MFCSNLMVKMVFVDNEILFKIIKKWVIKCFKDMEDWFDNYCFMKGVKGCIFIIIGREYDFSEMELWKR